MLLKVLAVNDGNSSRRKYNVLRPVWCVRWAADLPRYLRGECAEFGGSELCCRGVYIQVMIADECQHVGMSLWPLRLRAATVVDQKYPSAAIVHSRAASRGAEASKHGLPGCSPNEGLYCTACDVLHCRGAPPACNRA